MSIVTLQFDLPMNLPVDGLGVTVTADTGGTFTIASVAYGADTDHLTYTGTWTPADPVEGVDVVQVVYDPGVGNLVSIEGMAPASFNVDAEYNSAVPSPPVLIGTLTFPDATEGVPYDYDASVIFSGVVTSYTLESGIMGSGLTFNTTSGHFEGTPVGTVDLTGLSISATNGDGTSATSNTDTLTVNAVSAVTRVYVDQTLVVDVTDGSYSPGNPSFTGNAYNTLQKAIDNHVPGNHIVLRGRGNGGETYAGCWILPLALNGSSWTDGDYNLLTSCNTTNGGLSNEWAILDGQNACGRIGDAQGGQVIGYGVQSTTGSVMSYWRIERLEIKNGEANLDPDANTGGWGFHGNGGPFWFRHCYIHDNGGIGPTSCSNLPAGTWGYNWKDSIVEFNWYADNGNALVENNCKQIGWVSQYPDLPAQDDIRDNGFTTSTTAGYDKDNQIRYNLVTGGMVGIGVKHFCLFTSRSISGSGYDDTYKDYGTKVHHNILMDQQSYAIGLHWDFGQAFNNIIIRPGIGVLMQYDWWFSDPYVGMYKPCIYNNTIISPFQDGARGAVIGLGGRQSSDIIAADYKYVFNNIVDDAGGLDNRWGGESAIAAQITGTIDYDESTHEISHNYSYRPAASEQYYVEDNYYTQSQFEAQTITTAPRVAYQNNYDAGNELYASETGVTAYTVNGTHLIEAGVTVANGGIGGAHPYLTGVTLPSYVGAADPSDDGWVSVVNGLSEIDAFGVPINLRDGVEP